MIEDGMWRKAHELPKDEQLRIQSLAKEDPEYWSLNAQALRMWPRVDGTCWNCWKRPAEVDWVGDGGALAYVHGMSRKWCRRCTVEKSLEYARKQAARIPDLEAELASFDEH